MISKDEEVTAVLQRLLPAARADGGGFDVASASDDGRVVIRFRGACVACPSQGLTLRLGIEKALKAELPWVTEVSRAN